MAASPRRRAPRPRCANCGEVLRGPWCHACGQHAESLHRSVRQVALEWVQGAVHFDQRARATLPDLVFNPARLTRNYLEGRRAPQAPPLRMFLVVVLLVFSVGVLADWARAERNASPMFAYVRLTPATGLGKPGAPFDRLTAAQKIELHGQIEGLRLGPASAWTREHLHHVADNPKAYAEAFGRWSRRLAFLLLPIACGLLCLIFARRRDVMVFDHLVFAMHSLSFQGMLVAATELAAILPHAPALLILGAGPVHLFAHMRGVYATSIPGALARLTVLALGAALAFLLLIFSALGAGLVEVGA